MKVKYHPFLGCPKCKQLKLWKHPIPTKDRKTQHGLKCDNCKWDSNNIKQDEVV